MRDASSELAVENVLPWLPDAMIASTNFYQGTPRILAPVVQRGEAAVIELRSEPKSTRRFFIRHTNRSAIPALSAGRERQWVSGTMSGLRPPLHVFL